MKLTRRNLTIFVVSTLFFTFIGVFVFRKEEFQVIEIGFPLVFYEGHAESFRSGEVSRFLENFSGFNLFMNLILYGLLGYTTSFLIDEYFRSKEDES